MLFRSSNNSSNNNHNCNQHSNHNNSNSLKTIGFHFGGRDHTTVMHSVQTVSDLVDTDRKFREQVEELRKKFAQ